MNNQSLQLHALFTSSLPGEVQYFTVSTDISAIDAKTFFCNSGRAREWENASNFFFLKRAHIKIIFVRFNLHRGSKWFTMITVANWVYFSCSGHRNDSIMMLPPSSKVYKGCITPPPPPSICLTGKNATLHKRFRIIGNSVLQGLNV